MSPPYRHRPMDSAEMTAFRAAARDPPNVAVLANALRSKYSQNQQIPNGDENPTAAASATPPEARPLRRTTSTPRNGSVSGDPTVSSQISPSTASDTPNTPTINKQQRRASRVSAHELRASMTNLNEMNAVMLYSPNRESVFAPHPLMSRAPSISTLWYPPPPPPPPFGPYFYAPNAYGPPPLPPDPHALRQTLKFAEKMERKRRLEAEAAMEEGGCGYYCCDGVAQLLWAIIFITLLGFVAALVLALFVL